MYQFESKFGHVSSEFAAQSRVINFLRGNSYVIGLKSKSKIGYSQYEVMAPHLQKEREPHGKFSIIL